MSIKNCEYCTKRDTCKKSIGFMFGGCSAEFEATEEVKKCYICGSENAEFYNECAVCGKVFCTDCGTLTEKGETCENCMD